MPTSTIDLVKTLLVFFNSLTGVSAAVGPELAGSDVTFSVSLGYSTVTFSIYKSDELYFRYSCLQPGASGPALSELYCRDTLKTELLKKYVDSFLHSSKSDTLLDPGAGGIAYTEQLEKYLTIAESIASAAYLCANGDDYRPGFFSDITVQTNEIILRQINSMNATSLDHKKNYSLRDLQFFIPLKPVAEPPKEKLEEEYIGMMLIHFSDRSSQNNKVCGDQIREKIDAEKKAYSSQSNKR